MDTENFVQALKKYDYSFFAITCVIFLIGILNLYSATHASTTSFSELYKSQLLWFLASTIIGIVVSFITPKTIYQLAYFSYFVFLGLLILVLLVGDIGMGAQRWIAYGGIRVQPSELAKIALVLSLSRWYGTHDPDKELGLKELLIPFIMTMIPAILIIIEPDLGGGLLFILIFLIISFYKKLKWKTIGILAIVGILSAGVMYKFGLKDYQKKRVMTFINPDADARGTGYNAIQSKIAIGSGQIYGKGFKNSSQASLNYLPENHTDFVFSIYNEEHGFIGALLLISLYLILFYRYVWLATAVPRMFDSIVAIGLLSIILWHTVVNMSMVMGLMPIVGLPLPYMSYGGSSLMTFGICSGIATSISNGRNLF